MPTKGELLNEIDSILGKLGAQHIHKGARDKHYGVWLFALAVDEAIENFNVELVQVQGHHAVFPGNPAYAGPNYTFARIDGARRKWQLHVDTYVQGSSGALHGVDVSLTPHMHLPVLHLDGKGLGIEAKCLDTTRLSPGYARTAIGFQRETLATNFWLVANRDGTTADIMLNSGRHPTRLFASAAPGTWTERSLRRGLQGFLGR